MELLGSFINSVTGGITGRKGARGNVEEMPPFMYYSFLFV